MGGGKQREADREREYVSGKKYARGRGEGNSITQKCAYHIFQIGFGRNSREYQAREYLPTRNDALVRASPAR